MPVVVRGAILGVTFDASIFLTPPKKGERDGRTVAKGTRRSYTNKPGVSPQKCGDDVVRTPLRTQISRFENWETKDLREYANRVAEWENGKGVLCIGAGPDRVVSWISRASQAQLARAMRERAINRDWPPLTPEKECNGRGNPGSTVVSIRQYQR